MTGQIGLGCQVIPIDLTGSLYRTAPDPTLTADSNEKSRSRADRCTCTCHRPEPGANSPQPRRQERPARGCEVCSEIEERRSSASPSRTEPKSILKKRCDFLRAADSGLEATLPREFQSFNLLNHESEYTLKDTLSSADPRLPGQQAGSSPQGEGRPRDEVPTLRSPQTRQAREKSSSKETARFNPEDQLYDWSQIGLTRSLDEKSDLGSLAAREVKVEDCVGGSGTILEEVHRVKQECDRLEDMLSGTRDRISMLRGEGAKPSHNGGIVRFPAASPKEKPFFSPNRSPLAPPNPEPAANPRAPNMFKTGSGLVRNLAAQPRPGPESPPRHEPSQRHTLQNPQATLPRTHHSDSKQQNLPGDSGSPQHFGRHFLSDTRRNLDQARPAISHTSDFSATQYRGVSHARKPQAPASHQDRNRSFHFETRDVSDWDRAAQHPQQNLPRDFQNLPRDSPTLQRAGPAAAYGLRAERTAGPAQAELEAPEDDRLLRQLIAEKNSVKRRVMHTLAEIPAMERRLDHCAQIVDGMRDAQIKDLLYRL